MSLDARVLALELQLEELTKKLSDLESKLETGPSDEDYPTKVVVNMPASMPSEAQRAFAAQWARSRGRY